MNQQTSSNVVSGFSALIVSATLLLSLPARSQSTTPDFSKEAGALLHRQIVLNPAHMSMRAKASSVKRWEWKKLQELPKAPVLFVHLWSVTCKPCVKELPFLAALIKKYQPIFDKKVDFLIMSLDEPAQIESFLAKLGDGAPSHIYQFAQEDVERSLGTMSLPMTLLVERDRLVVRQAWIGSIDTREDELKPGLERLVELVTGQAKQ